MLSSDRRAPDRSDGDSRPARRSAATVPCSGALTTLTPVFIAGTWLRPVGPAGRYSLRLPWRPVPPVSSAPVAGAGTTDQRAPGRAVGTTPNHARGLLPVLQTEPHRTERPVGSTTHGRGRSRARATPRRLRPARHARPVPNLRTVRRDAALIGGLGRRATVPGSQTGRPATARADGTGTAVTNPEAIPILVQTINASRSPTTEQLIVVNYGYPHRPP